MLSRKWSPALLGCQASLVQSMAMPGDQPSAGWGLHHWHFMGDIPSPLPSGVAGLSQA